MKKRLLFYRIAPLAVIALIVGVISSTTQIRPTPKAAQQGSAEVSTLLICVRIKLSYKPLDR